MFWRCRFSPLFVPAATAVAPSLRRAALTLVSRRFRRVFYSEAALWRSVRLTPSKIYSLSLVDESDTGLADWLVDPDPARTGALLNTQLALSARVGALVERLEVSGAGLLQAAADQLRHRSQWDVAALLRCLRPGVLKELHLSSDPWRVRLVWHGRPARRAGPAWLHAAACIRHPAAAVAARRPCGWRAGSCHGAPPPRCAASPTCAACGCGRGACRQSSCPACWSCGS